MSSINVRRVGADIVHEDLEADRRGVQAWILMEPAQSWDFGADVSEHFLISQAEVLELQKTLSELPVLDEQAPETVNFAMRRLAVCFCVCCARRTSSRRAWVRSSAVGESAKRRLGILSGQRFIF